MNAIELYRAWNDCRLSPILMSVFSSISIHFRNVERKRWKMDLKINNGKSVHFNFQWQSRRKKKEAAVIIAFASVTSLFPPFACYLNRLKKGSMFTFLLDHHFSYTVEPPYNDPSIDWFPPYVDFFDGPFDFPHIFCSIDWTLPI